MGEPYALKAALGYEERGFSVVPIREREKFPIVNWRQWQKTRATPTQIRMWWKQFPTAGVGIITGEISNLVVIDIDPGKGGTDDGMPPTGMRVTTGSGGTHLYYPLPEGGCGTWVGTKGVDVRGEGGLVVAPPTIHKCGEAYVWDPDEEPGSIETITIKQLVPSTEKAEALANGAANGLALDSKTWLNDGIQNGVGEGKRNQEIAKRAGYYAGPCRMPYDHVLEMCRLTNTQFKPPLEDKEVERTVRSICEAEGRTRQEEEKKATGAAAIEQESDELEFTDYDDYAEKYGGQEIRWLIPGFLTADTIGFIFGPPGSYKTWGELDLAVSIAQGTPFLGIAKPERTGTVMMFQQEDSHITIAERIATIWAGRSGLKMPNIENEMFIWYDHEERSNIKMYEKRNFRLDHPNAMANLEKMLIKFKPVAVFMDPFYSMVSTENNMEAAAQYLIELKILRDKYRCAFMIVHHTSKASRGTGARDGLHGSNFLNAANESSLAFHNIEGCPRSVVIQRRTKDAGPKDSMRIDYDIFDATADEPGEWRFNTNVTDIGEKLMRELISPDRKFEDGEGELMSKTPVKAPQNTLEKQALSMLRAKDILNTDVPKELAGAMASLMKQKRVRFNESTKMLSSVLTPSVANVI